MKTVVTAKLLQRTEAVETAVKELLREAPSVCGKEKKMIQPSELPLDIHTHTIASGHAYGTIREMAQSAAQRGLLALGISEHAPGIPGTCDPIYYTNLRVAPRNLYGVDIFYGCEANVLNDGTLSLDEKHINLVDYVIAGIHGRCYEDAGREQNTENIISCMKHPRVCLISHPDDDHTPLDYEKLVLAAKQYHTALEVNNSSLLKPDKRLNCVENYKRMLRLCREYRVPIIVSSDAHDPEYAGRFMEACALLNEAEFDKELIVNTSVEKFKAFIGM